MRTREGLFLKHFLPPILIEESYKTKHARKVIHSQLINVIFSSSASNYLKVIFQKYINYQSFSKFEYHDEDQIIFKAYFLGDIMSI